MIVIGKGKWIVRGCATVAILLSTYGHAQVSDNNNSESEADEQQAGQTQQKEEETLVIGSRRSGDYTVITEDAEKLVEMPGTLGDPLGAIFALPGVVYPGSGDQEPAVRGSSPNDNAYIVDFMPASYIFHDFGVSIFSEFILHDFQMYSAGFGPEYGGSTGAMFDLTLRQPENKDISATFDLSMLRSGIFVEGGVTESSAFYLSLRRSFLDLFVKPDDVSEDGIVVKEIPKDTDYQFKYAWDINDQNRFSISANGATDAAAAEFDEDADFVKSNPDFAGDAKLEGKYNGVNGLWEYASDSGTEFKLGLSTFKDESLLLWGDDFSNDVVHNKQTIKARYSVPLVSQFRLGFGAQHSADNYDYYLNQVLFVCTEFDPSCDTSRRERIEVRDTLKLNDDQAYVNGTWMPTDIFTLDVGAQWQTNDYTQETFVHPRIAAGLTLTDTTKLTAKAGTYNRFPDIVTILPSTGNPELKSPESTHYTLGLVQQFDHGWSATVETYYKTLTNLPLAIAENSPDASQRYSNGTEGEAYGVDIMINKNITDRWYGWLAMSYGKSTRKNTQTQEQVDYYLDTPLIVNWVMNWQATRRFNLGWRWSIRSGSAYTPIEGVQDNPYFEDSVLPIYGDAFSDRLPLYNRLDVRMKWDMSIASKDAAVILDIINALNYQNVDDRSLDYDKVTQPGDKVQTVDTVGLGITPALTFRITI